MSTSPPFEPAPAHRLFSADCFNRAWDLIEKSDRSPAEDEQMLLLSLTSLWHWTQRPDCTPRHLSIGYWQISRIHAILKQVEGASRYGQLCLLHSQNEPAFYLAYAHEALARAALIGGDRQRTASHLSEAQRLAAQVAEADKRAALEKDLDTIRKLEEPNK